MIRALPVLAALLVALPAAVEIPAERALRNYELIVKGKKQIRDLSPTELAELAELDRRLHAATPEDKRSPAQRCRDEEIRRAGGSPSELELRVIGLKCSQR